jgi:hypothetical protein
MCLQAAELRFQAYANIRVNYDVYSSNDDLLAKLRAGPTQYDIIVPTNWFIPTYQRLGLLQPLRQDLIGNLVNLDKTFVETHYDPGQQVHDSLAVGHHRAGLQHQTRARRQGRFLGGAVCAQPQPGRPHLAAA